MPGLSPTAPASVPAHAGPLLHRPTNTCLVPTWTPHGARWEPILAQNISPQHWESSLISSRRLCCAGELWGYSGKGFWSSQPTYPPGPTLCWKGSPLAHPRKLPNGEKGIWPQEGGPPQAMPFLSKPENCCGGLGSPTSGTKDCRPHLKVSENQVPPNLESLHDPPPPRYLWKLQGQVKEEGSRERPWRNLTCCPVTYIFRLRMPLQSLAPQARETLFPLQASSSVCWTSLPPPLRKRQTGLSGIWNGSCCSEAGGRRDRGVLQEASLRSWASPQMGIGRRAELLRLGAAARCVGLGMERVRRPMGALPGSCQQRAREDQTRGACKGPG